ncbi:putative peptidoglycan lipid II flippase [Altererythrobacter atlanticus]|uniref:Probable lipid II flippase MurJ n=1 Tax=Croceibacterium atlanticum TaxID=1267766 RepID=A0A0F7KV91_9SPHN|nr:murein biosynthesis integral membrane protein MurJ [Croceibacterium atlanticum]AKH42675.1 putative peptidoglycan biosynthesis protein MurJ [Croceibacterium atlanticum]MBB5731452.1 putative peptidoglycan lipid II flippase [Croceibacterium atlanticum]
MSLVRNVGTIGGLTLVSRVFGFLRDILLARVLGAGGVGDAWQLAFQLPNIFRRLFAEGAFSSAFVPLFNRRMTKDGDMTEARIFAEEVLAVLIPILILFSAAALIAMPWIAGLFANEGISSDPELYDLAVLMARLAFPYLAFMSLATVFAAILNSLSRFAAAAAAPILLNICLITALTVGAVQPDSVELRRDIGMWLGIAVTISGILQALWLGWWAWREGFRIRLRAPRLTADVKELGILVLPAILGAGVYQISRFIDLFFLSTLPDGAYTFLAMGDRLNQLPLGIIGIALGTAILPSLSRHIARDDHDGAFRLQSNAVELALLLTVPAAVALFISGSAFTRAFYTGGAYTLADSISTGAVVSALVVGLPAYVLNKVLIPNFFARKDTRTPVYTAGGALVINIGLNFLLVPRLGVVGLALAGSISAWCNVAALYAILASKGYFHLTRLVLSRIARITLAAAFMGGVLWYAMPYGSEFYSGSALERVSSVIALVALGGVAFLVAALLLKAIDRKTIDQLLRRPA